MTPHLLITVVCFILLLFSAFKVEAQDKPEGPNRLSAEQIALLNDARQLTQKVVQLHASKKFDEALPLARRVLELRRSVLGDNDQAVADALTNLAALHFAKTEFDLAESLFTQALNIYDNSRFISQQTAYVLDSLTVLRWREGDYDKAELYCKRAIEIKEKVFGVRSPKLLDSLENLLWVYESNRYPRTHALYERVLLLAENNKDKLSERLAQLLVMYHCSHRDPKEPADSVTLSRRIEQLLGWKPGMQQKPLEGGLLNGRALSLPKPDYPQLAREARITGEQIVVRVQIDECGNVTEAKALSGHSHVRFASINAATKARFSPTLIGRVPVKVTGIIKYNFMPASPF